LRGGRQPQSFSIQDNINFGKWKATSILWKMEDNLNSWENGRHILANGRQPAYFSKWKKTPVSCQMEDDLVILMNGRQPQYFENVRRAQKWKTTPIFCQIEDNINSELGTAQPQHVAIYNEILKSENIF
jgi:hypothetical protein